MWHAVVIAVLRETNRRSQGINAFVAGLTGLLLASMALQSGASAPIKHLRTINPYVAAALSDWRRHSGLRASVPLQTGPAVAAASATEGLAVAGTSSFGMSGVNAHALVASASTAQLPSIAAHKVRFPLPCCSQC